MNHQPCMVLSRKTKYIGSDVFFPNNTNGTNDIRVRTPNVDLGFRNRTTRPTEITAHVATRFRPFDVDDQFIFSGSKTKTKFCSAGKGGERERREREETCPLNQRCVPWWEKPINIIPFGIGKKVLFHSFDRFSCTTFLPSSPGYLDRPVEKKNVHNSPTL